MRHWKLANVRGGRKQVVRWNGERQRKGFAPEGKYTFKVYPTGKPASDPIQETTRSRRQGKTRLNFRRHMFPLPARHTYGDGFGAGRNHQGQDLFAKCGKKVRAARGGRVQYSGYHSAAGYYAVIDGRGTRWDYVYMHLLKRGKVRDGKRVRTGDVVGYNGETGNASGCHLHFETWSPTGWYEGGEARPPTRKLKKWDRYS
jgi:murein DD-endopeptidase MepM/ murein hydrolase activator NlpD